MRLHRLGHNSFAFSYNLIISWAKHDYPNIELPEDPIDSHPTNSKVVMVSFDGIDDQSETTYVEGGAIEVSFDGGDPTWDGWADSEATNTPTVEELGPPKEALTAKALK